MNCTKKKKSLYELERLNVLVQAIRVEENINILINDEAKIKSEIITKLPVLLLSQFEISFELHQNYDVLTPLTNMEDLTN